MFAPSDGLLVSGIRVVIELFCVDQLNPAGLISVSATLPKTSL